MSYCNISRVHPKQINFYICEPQESNRNFLLWHFSKPEKHRHKNEFVKHSAGWNKVVIQEYLFQMCVPIMHKGYMEMNGLKPIVVLNLFKVWIEEMAIFLHELSPTFYGLPGQISQHLSICNDMSISSWTRNPIILSKILHASQGGWPTDVIQHVLPGCEYIFGPWLCYYVSNFHGSHNDVPFRLEDKNPPFLNYKFPIKKIIMGENKRTKLGQVNHNEQKEVKDPTRVEVQVAKHHGVVVMRSKFSVLSRFLFWFFRQAHLDPWTSFHLSFQTEYYLFGFFRISSISQLEAEMDWLIAWVGFNNMSSFGLPCEVFQPDVLTLMKQAIRAKSLPLDDSLSFGYHMHSLQLIIPSTLSMADRDIDMHEKFELLFLKLDLQERSYAEELYYFVYSQAQAHFAWESKVGLEERVDKLLFPLVFGFGIVSILELQNIVEDLVEFGKQSPHLCSELLRVLSCVLRCERPRCYDWNDMTWRKVDQLGHPLHFPQDTTGSHAFSQDTPQVLQGSIVTGWSDETPNVFHDDYIKCGGQMPYYAFHTGTGFKQVVVANSMNIEIKQSLLGRTNAYNSEGNVPKAMVAKTPHSHVFCPGKFSFWETTDKHLFHFLCDEVAKISTNKSDYVCRAWSLSMTNVLNELGIKTTLELYHDLCCVPSSTLTHNLFNEADRKAALLAFWQVQQLQCFNLSFFTKVDVFDWEDPLPYGRDPNDFVYDEDAANAMYNVDYVYEPSWQTIPLYIYFHSDTQRKLKNAI